MRRIAAMTTGCVCLMAFAAGCNHDGRYLRPARPDQDTTISTTNVATTLGADGADGGLLPLNTGFDGSLDGSADGSSVAETAVETTVPPSASETGGAAVDSGASTTGAGSAVSLVAPWRDAAAIDARFTCDGANVSPPLSWSRAPAGTVEIAVTLRDDQAPDFVHWAVAGIDPAVTSLREAMLPDGAMQAINGSGGRGYTGPCPPAGQTHTYRLTVHYLGSQIELGDGAAGADMALAIDAATIASATVTGTYARP